MFAHGAQARDAGTRDRKEVFANNSLRFIVSVMSEPPGSSPTDPGSASTPPPERPGAAGGGHRAASSPDFDPDRDIALDAGSLRGLAHPVRLRMLGLLRTEGPATATRLAARLGLNSGATSYHLRQLATHGFVVEATDPQLEQ